MKTLMIFSVPKMTCGHCISAIEKVIKAKGPAAVIATNLDLYLGTVQSTLEQAAVRQTIVDAGYDASVA